MATMPRILDLIAFALVMIASLSTTCQSLEASTGNGDSSAGKTEQQATAFGASTSSFDEMSKFMERSGNLFFGQQPAQTNAAPVQNTNQAQLLPYFPNGGSQIYADYTAQGNTNRAGVQPIAPQAQIPNYVNVPQRAPLLAQGNVAMRNVQQDNNMHQQALGGNIERTGSYGGYIQDDGYGGKSEYEYKPNGYYKEVKVPQVGVGINIDPFRFIRALLRAIPRPLLNLNGKVFFGVELGNKFGLVPKKEVKEVIVAKPYAAAHGGHY